MTGLCALAVATRISPALRPHHPNAAQSPLFSDGDLLGMFSLFDPVSNNFISADQARTALRNLGIKDLSGVPEAGATRVEASSFVAIARAALDKERVI